jgi:hypothetical protein
MKKTIFSIFALCATIAASAQTVTIDQAAASSNTYVKISQEGTSVLTVNQLGANGSFEINQFASVISNAINIDQLGDYDAIDIIQEGIDNTITIEQSGAGSIVGDLNTINILQNWASDNNDVTVTTGGTENTADIDQLASINSTIKLEQRLFNSDAVIKQDGGSGNSIDAIQSGTGAGNNYLNILQDGFNGVIKLEQTGDGNSFTIDQSGIGNTISGASSTYAVQEGSGNFATLTQSGSSNDIIFSQVGSGTSVTLTQSGSNNISTINVVL